MLQLELQQFVILNESEMLKRVFCSSSTKLVLRDHRKSQQALKSYENVYVCVACVKQQLNDKWQASSASFSQMQLCISVKAIKKHIYKHHSHLVVLDPTFTANKRNRLFHSNIDLLYINCGSYLDSVRWNQSIVMHAAGKETIHVVSRIVSSDNSPFVVPIHCCDSSTQRTHTFSQEVQFLINVVTQPDDNSDGPTVPLCGAVDSTQYHYVAPQQQLLINDDILSFSAVVGGNNILATPGRESITPLTFTTSPTPFLRTPFNFKKKHVRKNYEDTDNNNAEATVKHSRLKCSKYHEFGDRLEMLSDVVTFGDDL